MRLLGIAVLFLALGVSKYVSADAASDGENCNSIKNDDLILCVNKKYTLSDKILNEVYQKNINLMSAENKKELKDVQIAWIRFKERHCQNIYDAISPGREADIEKILCLLGVTKKRTYELLSIESGDSEELFSDILSALHGVGYGKSEVVGKLVNASTNGNNGWKEYVSKSCNFSSRMSGEKVSFCMARLNLFRGE